MFRFFRKKDKPREEIQTQEALPGEELLENSPVENADIDDSGKPDADAEPDMQELEIAAPVEKAEEELSRTHEQGIQSSGFFARLASGLKKTRSVLTMDIDGLFSASKAIDESVFEELEEILITADFGMDITMEMMETIRKKARRLSNTSQLHEVVKEEIAALFADCGKEDNWEAAAVKPLVIMVVGVNGTGKTTTLGKLAARYTRQGKKVLIAAADTFRAAAIEQVETWAARAKADVVHHREGSDPSAVVYDALEASIARKVDVLLVDTAGRLHTQKNLMEELKKMKRTLSKKMPGAPHEVLMVLDATTGQNAISQANIFHEAVGVSRIALTKLDGTAKGGIVAAISRRLQVPIAYVGVGEKIDDLQPFDSKTFVRALLETAN